MNLKFMNTTKFSFQDFLKKNSYYHNLSKMFSGESFSTYRPGLVSAAGLLHRSQGTRNQASTVDRHGNCTIGTYLAGFKAGIFLY